MRASLEGITSSQRDLERVFREWATRAGWPTMTASPAEPRRDGAEGDADRLREEVAALRDRLRSLEERLQKRRAESG